MASRRRTGLPAGRGLRPARRGLEYKAKAADTFGRGSGKTNPNEDPATAWEAFLINTDHGGMAVFARDGPAASTAGWATTAPPLAAGRGDP